MLDSTNCNIEKVSVHYIGNKVNDEDIILSKSLLDISDIRLRELFLKYFLVPFTATEFYSFTFTNDDFTLNPLYHFTSQIFDSSKTFHRNSVDIAKHLYEVSLHPQIKSGDLFVVYFSGISIDGEDTDAIGIFKSENTQSFLRVAKEKNDFSVNHYDGINIEKLDKGCLIFNSERNNGFKISIINKSSKSAEAQFWKDNFLMLRPATDEFHQTKQFLSITQNYITKQFSQEFDVSKADQIDLLNRSVEYFKTHDTFEKKEFEKEVLYHPEMIRSFRNFDQQYRDANEIPMENNFDISPQAVKKQARIFKSVLKLDKNFHIYIHGDKDLIERGVEKDGRKFYKIYYNNESLNT